MAEVEEQILQIATLNDRLSRVDIRAPSDGVVYEMQVTTEGGGVAPRLDARVALISPAAVVDDHTGQSFYRLTLAVSAQELARLGDVEILPGLPVEAYLQTGDRSVMSYLLAPMSQQLRRAFRED